MKTWRVFFPLLAVLLISITQRAAAQTMQRNLNASFDGTYFPCIGRSISGPYTLHFTYHINKKTGKIDRMHWNVLDQNLRDTKTGEEVVILDTGKDNIGLNFSWFNSINSFSGPVKVYDVEDGWLKDLLPGSLAQEGSYVEMNWKFMVGGEVYNISYLTQVHINANGELKADKSKVIVNCLD